MKKLSILSAGILTILAFSIISFTNSCQQDKCKDITCLNGGTCTDGTCTCPAGYSGTDCGNLNRSAFIKNWNVVSNSCLGGTGGWTVTVVAGSGADDIILQNFGHFICGSGPINISAKVTSATAFTIPSQLVCGTTYDGSGSLNGTSLNVTYNWSDPTQVPTTGSCSEVYN